MPGLEGMRLATAIIERCRRRGAGAGEATVEACPAGVSTGRVEDAGEALWGPGVSAPAASNLNDKSSGAVETWRNRSLERSYPYVYAGGIYLKRARGGSCGNAAAMVAVGAAEGLAGPPGAGAGPVLAPVPGPARHGDARRRQGRRDGRPGSRDAPRRGLPAPRRALLPQRARGGPEGEASAGNVQFLAHFDSGIASR